MKPLFQDIRERAEKAKCIMSMPGDLYLRETYVRIAALSCEVDLLTKSRTDIPKLLEAIDVMAAALESVRHGGFNPFRPSSESSNIASKALAHVRRLSEEK